MRLKLSVQQGLALLALSVLAACSKDKEINPPAQLVDFPATLEVKKVWDAGVDGESEALRLGLALALESERVYAAGRGGDVAAFELASGRQLWRTRTRARLAGGPGVGHDLVVAGSSDGEVVALSAADGKERWRVKINGEVLTPPAISRETVVVRTVDGRLRGLSTQNGQELWLHEQAVPRLSLRGTSKPVIVGETVFCGFDNGKVVAVNLNDGSLVWEAAVAPARGRTELERLVDIDSAVRVVGDDVYAVGFQGRVALLARETGQIWWSQEASSYRGMDLDEDALYLSNADGEIVARRRRTGEEIWRQKALKYRGLSAPAVVGNTVAVADFQGVVHWLDKSTGALAARARMGEVRVTNPPVAVGDMLLVVNDVGRITAFRANPTAAAATPAAP